MYKVKYKISLILILLLLISSVLAAPPVSTAFSNVDGFDLDSSNMDYRPVGQTIIFPIHVFNSSNGVRIINTTSGGVSCKLRVSNTSGVGQYSTGQLNKMSSSGEAWSVKVLAGNFSSIGIYNYLWTCNSSTHGGWYQGYFEVTEDGLPPKEESGSVSISIILFVLALALIFLLTPIIIPELHQEPWVNNIIKRGLTIIGVYVMILNTAIMHTLITESGLPLKREFSTLIWLLGTIGYILMAYLVLKALSETKTLIIERNNKKRGYE